MPGTTENTIIAAFASSAEANAAAKDLQTAGISPASIHVEADSSTGAYETTNKASNGGGITGWFKSIFGDETDHPDRSGYENAIQQGNALLRVDANNNQISTIENIINRHSPIDVHASSETKGGADNDTRAIPVVEEQLQIGKRQVLRGGVRVFSRVIEQPVEESVQLREERVRMERRPVNRAATEADLRAGDQKVIEVQEFAEEPVIAKQARVVEEVRVGKDVTERTETVRDTVRHTEVDVEPASGASNDADFRSDFQKRYASSGGSYETYLPAYSYGRDMASDPRYQGRSFDEIEPDLRNDYGRRYPGSAWEKMKDAVSYGWSNMTGKTKSAAR